MTFEELADTKIEIHKGKDYQNNTLEYIINKIVGRTGCGVRQAKTLLFNALDYNCVQEELFNQIDFILDNQ